MTYGALRSAATARSSSPIAMAAVGETATRGHYDSVDVVAVAAGERTRGACGVVVASTSSLREQRSTRRTGAARTIGGSARTRRLRQGGRRLRRRGRRRAGRPQRAAPCSSAVTVNAPRAFESLSTTPRDGITERRSYVRALERHDAAVRVGGLQQLSAAALLLRGVPSHAAQRVDGFVHDRQRRGMTMNGRAADRAAEHACREMRLLCGVCTMGDAETPQHCLAHLCCTAVGANNVQRCRRQVCATRTVRTAAGPGSAQTPSQRYASGQPYQ